MRRIAPLAALSALLAAVVIAAPAARPAAGPVTHGLPRSVADHQRIPHPELDGDPSLVQDQLAVRFKPGLTPAQIDDLHARHGLTRVRGVPQLNLESVAVPAGKSAEVIAALTKEAGVATVAPNHVLHAAEYTPSDPYFSTAYPTSHDGEQRQWGLQQVHAPAAWSAFRGPGSVTVAVLDTGVDSTHPDLQGHLLPGWNFVDDNADTFDDHGHGTATAGIAGAATDNATGVASIGFDTVQVLPVKVLDSLGNGSEVDVADGITWAADHGARVISMSLGGSIYSQALEDAARYAWSKGCVLVAAGGNNADGVPQYPASDSYVVGVSATDQNDQPAPFDSHGPEISVAAPGVSILSTMPTYPVTMTTTDGYQESYDAISGTSASTPLVAGLAALLIAQQGGSVTAQDVVADLERSATAVAAPGWNDSAGWGRVDATALIGGSFRADATGSIRGQVTDANGDPLGGAVVSDGGASATTAADGYYRLAGLAAGAQTLTVQAGGAAYTSQPVSVQSGADTYLDFQAAPTSTGGSGNPAVVNGGFESGSFSGWTADGGAPAPTISRTTVHSGSYSALLGSSSGAEGSGDSSLAQTVQISLPAGNTKATLSFWYWAATTDVAPFDAQQAKVQDSSGAVLATVFDQAANPRSWQQATFDLTPYAGRSVRLWFNAHQDGAGDPTWMYLDDVEVSYS